MANIIGNQCQSKLPSFERFNQDKRISEYQTCVSLDLVHGQDSVDVSMVDPDDFVYHSIVT